MSKPSLDPRSRPDSCDKRPSSPMGLGHLVPVCQQLACVEANEKTPPAQPHHREDPPFLPSVKGSRLRTGRTWGVPEEMAFLRVAAGWFQAYTWAAHAH